MLRPRPHIFAAIVCPLLCIALTAALSAADCNFNGIEDGDETAQSTDLDCNANGIPDTCETAPPAFRARSVLSVGGVANSFPCGDVNGDEIPDVIAGHNRGFTVLLQRPAEREFDATDYPVDGAGKKWLLLDVDSDNDLDVVGVQTRRVVTFLNNGEAEFAGPVDTEFDSGVESFAAGDIDADGIVDVVLTNRVRDQVSVLFGRGDGRFDRAAHTAVGEFPLAVAIADLDGDGDLDVATANRDGNSVTLLSNDQGELGERQDVQVSGSSPQAIVAADFGGTSLPELVVGTLSSTLLLENRGGELTPRDLTVGLGIQQLSVTDVNGDGKDDIVGSILDPRAFWTLTSLDAGEFSLHSFNLGDRPEATEGCDLDGDGDSELCLGFFGLETVNVLWNDDSVERNFLSFGAPEFYEAGGRPHTAGTADFNGDGHLDLVTGNNRNSSTGMSVYINRGDGTFLPRAHYNSIARSFAMVVDDFDLDGHLEFAVADPSQNKPDIGVMRNRGDGTFVSSHTHNLTGGAFHVTSGDLDGDSFPDLVASMQGVGAVALLFNAGDGTFTNVTDIRVGARPVSAAVVDVDDDGHRDIAVATLSGGGIDLLRGDGSGLFSDPERFPLANSPSFVIAVDMNVDGAPDLVTVSESGQNATVLWNQGRGGFSASQPWPLRTKPYSVLEGDMNADGLPDIVALSELIGNFSLLLNGGDMTFSSPILLGTGPGPRYGAIGDFDGTGTDDLMSANRPGNSITVIRNQTDVASFPAAALELICTEKNFLDISRRVTTRGLTVRATKYVAPARADDASLLSTQYQNVNRFELHEEFLGAVFPERFPSLPGDREFYNQLIGRRATRDYYVGVLTRRQAESGPLYTFTAVTDTGFSVGEILEQEELEGLYTTLKESFTLEPLAYEPDTELARRKAETFQNPQFPVHFDDGAAGLDYEPYTLATGYGRVRLLTLEEFNDANDSGTFTFQDVLVVDLAPRDIEGIVGGVITAEPQGNLSHVAVRTARRGTPNAFVKDARDVFAPLEGKLVRLQVFDTEFFVDEVELEEAQEFWDSNRPRFEPPPTFDELYSALDSLAEIDLDSDPVSRFGGKASNFSRLQRLLTGTYQQYQERGFAIPMHHYLRFMNENTLTLEGGRTLTFQQHLDEILAAPEFQSDSQLRFEALDEFRDRVRGEGVVDPALIAALAVRIEEVFGDTTTMVRFRSSSNVEDRLVFNGAGLYESTSVCAQDTLDPASPDASHCDPTRTNERTIERALKKVWSSLWTFRAHEERTFFQIPPQLASMGILCSRAFLDESANGVAFTGNPTSVDDKRYVITAQLGEESVVSPEPGVSIERSLLEVAGGQVVRIIRDRSSTLVPPGEVILTDEQLIELGGVMAHADAAFELDLEGHQRREVLLDFEFKIEPDGSLAIKQVRPFLIPNTAPKTPTFELEVPEGSMVCSVFSKERVGREPRREFETKSTVRLVPGVITLPTASDTLSGELFAEVRFGAAQELAVPLEDGLFRLEKVSAGGSLTTYRFSFEQTFALGESDVLALRVFGIDFKGRGEVPIEPAVTLNDEYLTFDLTMEAELNGEPIASYSSCTYSLLPQFELAFELDGGDSINIRERFLEAESLTSTGPAAVVHAAVELGGERRVVTDYWKLVYTAQRHNLEVRYWILFEPAISAAGLAKPVHAVEVAPADREIVVPPGAPPIVRRTESSVTFLDADFEPIATPAVIDFSRRTVDSTEPRFRRGDVNSDGIIDLADALAELSYLFRSGETPVCLKAADADDDGRLNVSDAITILLHLFRGAGPLPQPGVACGVDSSSDALACESQSGCR